MHDHERDELFYGIFRLSVQVAENLVALPAADNLDDISIDADTSIGECIFNNFIQACILDFYF